MGADEAEGRDGGGAEEDGWAGKGKAEAAESSDLAIEAVGAAEWIGDRVERWLAANDEAVETPAEDVPDERRRAMASKGAWCDARGDDEPLPRARADSANADGGGVAPRCASASAFLASSTRRHSSEQ